MSSNSKSVQNQATLSKKMNRQNTLKPSSAAKARPNRKEGIALAIAQYTKRPEGLKTSEDFRKAMLRRGLYAPKPRPGKDLLLGKGPAPKPSGRIEFKAGQVAKSGVEASAKSPERANDPTVDIPTKNHAPLESRERWKRRAKDSAFSANQSAGNLIRQIAEVDSQAQQIRNAIDVGTGLGKQRKTVGVGQLQKPEHQRDPSKRLGSENSETRGAIVESPDATGPRSQSSDFSSGLHYNDTMKDVGYEFMQDYAAARQRLYESGNSKDVERMEAIREKIADTVNTASKAAKPVAMHTLLMVSMNPGYPLYVRVAAGAILFEMTQANNPDSLINSFAFDPNKA